MSVPIRVFSKTSRFSAIRIIEFIIIKKRSVNPHILSIRVGYFSLHIRHLLPYCVESCVICYINRCTGNNHLIRTCRPALEPPAIRGSKAIFRECVFAGYICHIFHCACTAVGVEGHNIPGSLRSSQFRRLMNNFHIPL